ncbi:calcium-activated chloride channel-domain-containing protein [Chytriomyces sp. MP71]|nr:calcium-activated chloride channel-domain-containing protein [Chytriomyces sp. MP71]
MSGAVATFQASNGTAGAAPPIGTLGDAVTIALEDDAQQLYDEAFKLLPDSWHATEAQDGAILTRRFEGRLIHFFYDEDLVLFDEIVTFRARNPEAGISKTMSAFASREHADVMCKIAYATSETHWDAVLEAPVRSDEDEPDRVLMRANFERELLRHRLVLVRERGPTEMKLLRKGNKHVKQKPATGDELGSHYIKIVASFRQLCKEAERLKLKLEMINKEKHLYNKINDKFAAGKGHFRPSESHRRAIAQHAKAHSVDDAEVVDTADIAGLVVKEGEAVIQEVKNEVVEIGNAIEMSATSLKGFIDFAFVLVHNPVEVRTHPFDDAILREFVGGDGPPESVQLNFFSTMHRNMMTNVIVQRCQIKVAGRKRPVGVNDLLVEHNYSDFYAVHDGPFEDHSQKAPTQLANARSWLYFQWARLEVAKSKLMPLQPMKEIRNYFGEYVAFYFAWLGFYTVWLLGPAVVGLAVFIYSLVNAFTNNSTAYFDNALTIPFALFMSVWGTLFLRFWSRRAAALRTVWDLREVSHTESQRPEYYGTKLRKDPVTGKVVPYMPSWQKLRLRLATYTTVFLAILLMIAFEFLIIISHAKFKNSSMYVSTTVSSVLSLVNIIVLTPGFLALALFLNRKENHKTQLGFENHLLAKSFIVSAIQNYSYLIYVGIFKVFAGNSLQTFNVSNETCFASFGSDSCVNELMLSMAIVFIGVQTFCQLQAVAQPRIEEFFRMRALQRKINDSSQPVMTRFKAARRVAPQYILDDVLNVWVRRDEFTAKIIEYGFVVWFSLSFPLAPALALMSSLLEIRFGAYRLVVECKRPFGMRAQDIGAWRAVLDSVTFLGILVNACIIAFSSGYFHQTFLAQFENDSTAKTGIQLAFILIFEHAVLLITGIFEWIIPAEPKMISNAVERESYLNRVANGEICEVDDDNDADNNPSPQPQRRSTLRGGLQFY